MNIESQIESGYLSIKDLDIIANDIISLSNKHGMNVRWKASMLRADKKSHTIRVRVIQHKVLLWEQTYSDMMWHRCMAFMYAGVYNYLSKKDLEYREWEKKMMKEKQEREEERRIASMPSWTDKIKNQLK